MEAEMIAQIVDRYAEKAPAALMFRGLFSRLFSDNVLDEVFSNYREKQVESPLLFSYLVGLLVPVISGSKPSVNAAHQSSENQVSRQAVYDKLKGIETRVSSALVRSTVGELIRIQDKLNLRKKDIIPGFHTYVVDGKTYDATEHRLLESRRDSRAPLPGRAIAVLDTRHELFVDIECEANAYRCERKILTPLFDRVESGALYILDRNFSDGDIIWRFIARKAYFVIRQHGACPAWREIPGEKRIPHRCSSTVGGKVFEQAIEVCLPNGTWVKLRRVTIELKNKTRDGDKTLHFLTNLPIRVKPVTICTAYRSRWKIETCLGFLSQSLNAEIRTLCYPGAAGLCFCIALVLFNMISTLKSLLESKGKQPDPLKPIELSYYYMTHEIAEYHAGLSITFDDHYWKRYATMSLTEFTRWLASIAANADLKRYRKHTRGPKKPKPKRKFTGSRHIATQKLLEARK
jgi:Transposase DDE domain